MNNTAENDLEASLFLKPRGIPMSSMTGLALMFALGLRHGLDPDHIACIDGLTWRAIGKGKNNARWIGSMFALGHGALVTLMAMLISKVSTTLPVSAGVWTLLEWVPTALLVLVGTLNLKLLLKRDSVFVPTGWKMRLIPKKLRESSSPWAVVAIGVLFATVFDTATQASAWGYVALNQEGGIMAALTAGLMFTSGMIITDTIDSHIVCHVSRTTEKDNAAHGYRKTLGWLIVAMTYGMAIYNIATHVMPDVEMSEVAFSLTGFVLMIAMLLVAVLAWMARKLKVNGCK